MNTRDDHGKVLQQIQDILRANGIRMAVGGCGCCGSPWVAFEYNGVRVTPTDSDAVYGLDEADFNMFEEEELKS